MRRAEDIAFKQPRGISVYDLETAKMTQYVESEDEPWHATCRPRAVLTKKNLASAFNAQLPFIAPEEQLEDNLVKCTDEEAIKKCIEAGGRPGCPAIEGANKLKKDMAKA